MPHFQRSHLPVHHSFRFGLLTRRASRPAFAARLLAVLFLLLAALPLAAQIVESGVITGTAHDASGAVVATAKVTIENIATGLVTQSQTDSHGLFVSPPLPAGSYRVEVQAEGFHTVAQKVRLDVGQRLATDAVLTLGKTSEVVDVVETSSSLLETETSTVSNLRTEDEVKDLPLNGRNFAELVGLGAGVVPAQTQITTFPYTQQRGPTSYAVERPSIPGKPRAAGWHWRQRKP